MFSGLFKLKNLFKIVYYIFTYYLGILNICKSIQHKIKNTANHREYINVHHILLITLYYTHIKC